MRNEALLALIGAVLVVVGVAFLERSWGWTLPLAVVGVAVMAFAAVRAARSRSQLGRAGVTGR